MIVPHEVSWSIHSLQKFNTRIKEGKTRKFFWLKKKIEK